MSATITRLEPITPERACQLDTIMREVQDDPSKGLSIDDEGRITAVIAVDDPDEKAILGDFDVHA
ncbi:MAG: hypothetical protein AAF745_07575 [Planctomycetota bacterium]